MAEQAMQTDGERDVQRRDRHTVLDSLKFDMFTESRTETCDFDTYWSMLKSRTYNSVAYNDLDSNYAPYTSKVRLIITELKKELFLNKVLDEYTEYLLERAMEDSSAMSTLNGARNVTIDTVANLEVPFRNLKCCHKFNKDNVCVSWCKQTAEQVECSYISLKECIYVTKYLRTLDTYKYLECEMEKSATLIQEDGQQIKLSREDETLAQKYIDEMRQYMKSFNNNRTLLEYLCNRECRNFLMVHYRKELDYVMRVYQFLQGCSGLPKVHANQDNTNRIRHSYKHLMHHITKKCKKPNLERLLVSCKHDEIGGLIECLQDTTPTNSLYTHSHLWTSFLNGTNITSDETTFKAYMSVYMHRRRALKNITQTLTDMNMMPAKSGFVYDLMIDNRSCCTLSVTKKHGVYMLSVNGSYYREFKDLYSVQTDELKDHTERTPLMSNQYGPLILNRYSVASDSASGSGTGSGAGASSRTLRECNVSARSYKSLFVQNLTGDHYYKNAINYYMPSSDM